MARFKDDDAIECYVCGEITAPGYSYSYIKKGGYIYRCCENEECQKNLLFELYGGEFSSVYLKTAEDHAFTYADMQYSRWKDET